MSDEPSACAEKLTATFTLATADWKLEARMTVPKGPTTFGHLLPVIQNLTDAMVRDTVQGVEQSGKKISCQKGCGACCSQLVPLSTVDARRIGAVVQQMPEPRRSEIRARFSRAHQRLDAAGLLDPLWNAESWTEQDRRTRGIAYFEQGVPCPFLEAGSCSIYEDRPLACREYLVTSPAANCAQPTPESVETVAMPLKIWLALARCEPAPHAAAGVVWVPLILAPQWAEAHSDEPAPRPGPDLLREFVGHLTGKMPPA